MDILKSTKRKKIYMYDGAELYYQDVELKSGIIVLDYKKMRFQLAEL